LKQEAATGDQIKYELIIIGATEESPLHNFLVGNIPEKVDNSAKVTVIIVRGHNHPIRTIFQAIIKKWSLFK
jgi:nucleotide-binding universal stress UspA family protein